ncbi:hypothetical protein K2Z83_27720 [Oscillochloris sp. ZM17-4]|uniref:hypothetical protein n=1 Tax=Oscillochloris sp. ZM17-4 TaxID=2866714 RepID=UPI001C73B86F|nr:hypothetical protein [Oscillochloris sp. ZM17-4]MBX0331446.1 hypothetical protein [Oscillochloris sp. ZM17-4]
MQEKEELASVMRGLVKGIDGTLRDIGKSVKTVSGAAVPFSSLDDNDDICGYLDYIHKSLTDNALLPRRAGQAERASAQPQYVGEDEASYNDQRPRVDRR